MPKRMVHIYTTVPAILYTNYGSETAYKEVVVAYLRKYPEICVEGLGTMTKALAGKISVFQAFR
jgi:hypothetical protein